VPAADPAAQAAHSLPPSPTAWPLLPRISRFILAYNDRRRYIGAAQKRRVAHAAKMFAAPARPARITEITENDLSKYALTF